MQLSSNFVPENEDDIDGFDALPAGEYLVQATEAEELPTKANDGSSYIKVTYDVMDGPYKSRKLFINFNYVNNNEMAQRIGRGQLKQATEAIGIANLIDTDQMLFKPFLLKIKIRKQEGYSDSNQFVSARANGGGAARQPSQQQAAQRQTAQRQSASTGGQQQPRQRVAARQPQGDRPWGNSGGQTAADDDIPF